MRFDRSLSIYFGHPISRIANRNSQAGIPILMYHGIREEARQVHPYYETNTSLAAFANQMELLQKNGYATVGIKEAVESISGKNADKKSVVITFDDGFRDFYSAAFPILRKHKFSATVFIPTGMLGEQRSQWKNDDLMTWSEVRELQSCGVRFGSHTVNHLELENLEEKEVERELSQSKQTLEDKLGVPVHSFAYPYAFPQHNRSFTHRLAALLEKHGYRNGVSTMIGRARRSDHPLFLPRLPINTWDDSQLFRTKLEGGYDWLHLPQSVYKKVRHYVNLNAAPRMRPAV